MASTALIRPSTGLAAAAAIWAALRDCTPSLHSSNRASAPRLRLPHWIPLAVAHLEAPLARLRGREPRVPLDGVRMSKRKMFFDGGKAVRELGVPRSRLEPAIDGAELLGELRLASAQRVETGFLNRTATVGERSFRYQVYVPADYATRTDWPVILALHGAGERGHRR